MATPIGSQEINEDKMNQFLGKVVGDFGAALSTSLAYVGQKLGLYKAMAEAGPSTPTELAQKTNTNERYVREWLLNQASGGYVDYDATTGKYSLAPEQAVALTDENSPFFVGGGFFVVKAMNQAVERIESHFRDGGGMLWGEHHPDLFVGTARFFRPGYAARRQYRTRIRWGLIRAHRSARRARQRRLRCRQTDSEQARSRSDCRDRRGTEAPRESAGSSHRGSLWSSRRAPGAPAPHDGRRHRSIRALRATSECCLKPSRRVCPRYRHA